MGGLILLERCCCCCSSWDGLAGSGGSSSRDLVWELLAVLLVSAAVSLHVPALHCKVKFACGSEVVGRAETLFGFCSGRVRQSVQQHMRLD
jgi:hypothetical protein